MAMTYAEFKQAILELYPGSENECKWSDVDLMNLVEESTCTGMHSLGDLGDYYRQFLTLTAFLHAKGQLSKNEQNCRFTAGFQLELWNCISMQLQLKFPNHYPDDPYSLEDTQAATHFVLHGTTVT